VYKEAGKPAEAAAELDIVRRLRDQKTEDNLQKVTSPPPEFQPGK